MSAVAPGPETELPPELIDGLVGILGTERVLTDRAARVNRTRVPSPFPVHRWRDFVPQAVVLPSSTEEVAAIVRLANQTKTPLVPRAGATGLADGAVPLRRGVIVDIKLMDRVLEVDLEDRTVTVETGLNMMRLSERLAPLGFCYPDDPESYACALIGGRIGTNGFSIYGCRYGHTRDLVLSIRHVLPTGEILDVGEGGGRKLRRSSTGYQLKQLFMGHQGTLGIATEATLELVRRPAVEVPAVFGFADFDAAWRAVGELSRADVTTLVGIGLLDGPAVESARREDPGLKGLGALVLFCCCGNEDEVRPGARRLLGIARAAGGTYLGDEVSQQDWAARHDRSAIPIHGRTRDGDAALMSWHCEDASVNYSQIDAVRRSWHEIIERLSRRHDLFDDWGVYCWTNAGFRAQGDFMVSLLLGVWEQRLDEESWAAWIEAKREISEIALAHGGSISSCHGACRQGDAELVAAELGQGYEVMKLIKRTLDPNNVMNPGKYLLDRAYD